MKQSLKIGAVLVLALSLAACGNNTPDAAPSDDAAVTECIRSNAQQIADINQEPVDKYLEDADIRAMCEGFESMDDATMPAYTPAPAVDVDPACLRAWAEDNADLFSGMSTEEIMEDPMARFNCE